MSSSTTVFGEHEPGTLAQFYDVAGRAELAALMADGHQGYVMPIGGVAAYERKVSVVGVGFDIACGNAAIRTDLTLHGTSGLVERLPAIADEIQDAVSFGIGRKNRADDAPVDHPLFRSGAWDALPGHVRDGLRSKARAQLGTVGSGNHYVDVFVDESDAIWVGVHFGSRGFGHTVASGFLALSQNEKWGRRVPEREALLPLDQPIPTKIEHSARSFDRRRRGAYRERAEFTPRLGRGAGDPAKRPACRFRGESGDSRT